jgi:hypothetical protein
MIKNGSNIKIYEGIQTPYFTSKCKEFFSLITRVPRQLISLSSTTVHYSARPRFSVQLLPWIYV